MAGYTLLTLKLASALSYRRVDFEAEKFRDFAAVSAEGIPSAEGGETVLFYSPDSLVRFDEAEGPRILALPGKPERFGVSRENRHEAGEDKAGEDKAGEDKAGEGKEEEGLTLEPGLYGFMQWRVADAAGLAEGIEYFARETWWEKLGCRGPWILRRVAEDGKIATQLLARLAGQ